MKNSKGVNDQQAKMLKKEKIQEYFGLKRPEKTADTSNNANWRDKSKNIREQEHLDMAKKGKLYERNWISSDSSTKQYHKDKWHKSKIDKVQQNSKCRLCGYRDIEEKMTYIMW